MSTRDHKKINYETNVVDPITFAKLLTAVVQNQPLSYQDGKNKVFPKARSFYGMDWDEHKPDTHASNTLEQYALVNADKNRTITISDLGKRFLNCFDRDFNISVSIDKYKEILIEMLITWYVTKNGKSIHPGKILLNLMQDPDLKFYITDYEFALWTSDHNINSDTDYKTIKNEILDFRAKHTKIEKKKAEVFLRAFAKSWDIFNRKILDDTYIFTLKEDVIPIIKKVNDRIRFLLSDSKDYSPDLADVINNVLNNDGFTDKDKKQFTEEAAKAAKKHKKILYFDENYFLKEGEASTRVVKQKSRSKKLRDIAVEYYTKDNKIKCSICGFDFEEKYGELGKKYIEIHHIKPIYQYEEQDEKRVIHEALRNLTPVCSNCHRMLHRKLNITIDDLKKILNDLAKKPK